MQMQKFTRILTLAVASATIAIALVSCGEDLFDPFGERASAQRSDDCEPACSGALRCFLEAGEPVCLQPNCGDDLCINGASCDDGTCRFDSATCSPECAAGRHCVEGSCISNYTSANLCDPLAECRLRCGIDASCLASCDADRGSQCDECLDDLASCESSERCEANAEDCCETDFCRCFPSDPGCGNAEPCDLCLQTCGNDNECLNSCIADTRECSSCLQPFFTCQDSASDPSTECEDEFCDCATCD